MQKVAAANIKSDKYRPEIQQVNNIDKSKELLKMSDDRLDMCTENNNGLFKRIENIQPWIPSDYTEPDVESVINDNFLTQTSQSNVFQQK
jgi:hypothetical protein